MSVCLLAINKHVRIIKQFFYLRHKIKELRPDCVLSMGVETNIATLLSTIGLGIKIYVADRNNPFIKLSFLRQLLKKVLYQKAEGIICQTNLARQKVHGLTKHPNIVVIPNPITIFENDYVSIEKKNYIVNIGRFIKSKNQRELIDIFTLVNDGSWKLIFVGDGPCRKECMDYVSQKGISSYVEFVGVVKDVDRYLAQSKIFAFVSTSEGFPNALGEAVLFPTASISYNCPAGPEDIIRDDENGFLVPLGKVEEYATKLKMLMESEELRTRFEMSAVSDRSKYSMENIGESFFNFMF